ISDAETGASCSTSYDTTQNQLIQTTNINCGESFLSGLAYHVVSGAIPAASSWQWCGSFITNGSTISIPFEFGAAAYSNFTNLYNSLNISGCAGLSCTPYGTSQQGI